MTTQLFGLFAETSIHAGAGHSTGVIDLPIMREAHTNYPCIFGSAFKGALRSRAENTWQTLDTKAGLIKNIFGTESSDTDAWAGSLMVTDARLLLLPVRSLTTHFKLVTCPYVLERWQRDMKRITNNGFDMPKQIKQLNEQGSNKCLLAKKHNHKIYLEEFQYTPELLEDAAEFLDALNQMTPEDYDIEENLCIVSDDQFNHLTTIATSVIPHIRIENETKTVKAGALWYEESLPADSLFYVALTTENSRNKTADLSSALVMQEVLSIFEDKPYLQVGGNETVGMGWMQIINPSQD